jgi:hypothetical protein
MKVAWETCVLRDFIICIFTRYHKDIKSRRVGWERHVARMEDSTVAYKVSVTKPVGKIPLRRDRHG